MFSCLFGSVTTNTLGSSKRPKIHCSLNPDLLDESQWPQGPHLVAAVAALSQARQPGLTTLPLLTPAELGSRTQGITDK